MKLYEWIEWYNKKSPTLFDPHPDCDILFDENKGFCCWFVGKHPVHGKPCIRIDCTAGDGAHWWNVLKEKAKELNIKYAVSCTSRDISAYQRRFKNTNVIGYVIDRRFDE